jgi:hypothetical protein
VSLTTGGFSAGVCCFGATAGGAARVTLVTMGTGRPELRATGARTVARAGSDCACALVRSAGSGRRRTSLGTRKGGSGTTGSDRAGSGTEDDGGGRLS